MIFITSVALLAAALRVAAQPPVDPLGSPQYNDASLSDLIVYTDVWESCTDTSVLDTVTATITATACPLCSSHKTTWTTIWPTVCDTGIVDATYTITESCTGATPTWTHHDSYVPPGYTATQTVCTVCNANNKPTTVSITVPCDTTPTPGPPGPPGPPAPTGKPPGPSGPPGPPSPPASNPPGPPGPPATGTKKATTTTETLCNGHTTMCPKTSSTTATITKSHTTTTAHSSVLAYSPGGAGATMAPVAWGGMVGGALAAVGAALL